MPAPSEHKTTCLCVRTRRLASWSARRRAQTRTLKYAQEIGWTYVLRDKVNRRLSFTQDGATPDERAREASLFFDDLIAQLMTAQIHGHALELPEPTSFTAKGAR